MATRIYQYTTEELAQFQRLEQLGSARDDQTANRVDPELRFSHQQLGFAFTFLPDGVTFEGDHETNFWEVNVYRQSPSSYRYGTAQMWLTMTEFNALIDPERWTEMSAVLQSLENLAQWNEVMKPLLDPGTVEEPQKNLKPLIQQRSAR